MSTLQTELRLLRWPLISLGVALVIALAVGLTAWHFMQQTRKQTNQIVLDSLRIQDEARRLAAEEQEIHDKIDIYQAILARGIIGPERRLDWVELIRASQRERQLLDLEYEIQPQIPLPKANSNGGYTFMDSAMRVQIPLLHEEDLLRFITDIQTHASAFVRVRSCRITRAAPNQVKPGEGPSPNLQAECLLDWITLKDQTGGQP